MQSYVLGFLIVDTRSLQLEEGQLHCDPFVKVESCGRNYTTAPKTHQSPKLVSWNESQIWTDIQLYDEEFDTAYIDFTVYSRNWFTRNYVIGKAALQLKSINMRHTHMYNKKRILLYKEEADPAPTGEITISVFCVNPSRNEQPPNLNTQDANENVDDAEEAEEDDLEDLSRFVCGDASDLNVAERRRFNVLIDIIRVKDLTQVRGPFGVMTDPSPFVTVEFAGNRVKTEHATSVDTYKFMRQACLPVTFPIYEETILIKLWHHVQFGPDVLLAQGLISFPELYRNPLPATWFNLYGWDVEEIPDVKKISDQSGEFIRPNFFKGSLLVAGRVERATMDEVKQASMSSAKAGGISEPMMKQVVLLCDVYEVLGAVGRECLVSVGCGRETKETPTWVASSWDKNKDSDDEEASAKKGLGKPEETTTFKFSQEAGRIEPIFLTVPHRKDSQPLVYVNVMSRGMLSYSSRIGFATTPLGDLSDYEMGVPGKPKFLPVLPMPTATEQSHHSSILITLEKSGHEPAQRHNRKRMALSKFIVRCYCFMARNVVANHPSSFSLQVSCAGVSGSTHATDGEVRPMWMTPLQLRVMLSSQGSTEPPTCEPIVLMLMEHQGPVQGTRELGKSICRYEHLRQRDSLGEWEPYDLSPQWIRLKGGTYGTKDMAEVLVAFEMLSYEHAVKRKEARLQPKNMWPVPEKEFNVEDHFCKLRKATLHFSLLGLRDIVYQSSLGKHVQGALSEIVPEVTVQVKKFEQGVLEKRGKTPKYYEMKFSYRKVCEGGDESSKEDLLRTWRTRALGEEACMNYEIFQSNSVNILLPDKMILQPFINIRVKPARAGTLGGKMLGNTIGNMVGQGLDRVMDMPQVGEHRRSLSSMLPGTWYEGIKPGGSHEKQKELIRRRMKEGQKVQEAREEFEEESKEMRDALIERRRQHKWEQQQHNPLNTIRPDTEVVPEVNSSGLPAQLQEYSVTSNPVGFKPNTKQTLRLQVLTDHEFSRLNSFRGTVLDIDDHRLDDRTKGAAGPQVEFLLGKLEDSRFSSVDDLFFKNQPLLRDHDIVENLDGPPDDPYDWNLAYPSRSSIRCFGFVKCMFMLTDGWQKRSEGEQQPALTDGTASDSAGSAPAMGTPEEQEVVENLSEIKRRLLELMSQDRENKDIAVDYEPPLRVLASYLGMAPRGGAVEQAADGADPALRDDAADASGWSVPPPPAGLTLVWMMIANSGIDKTIDDLRTGLDDGSMRNKSTVAEDKAARDLLKHVQKKIEDYKLNAASFREKTPSSDPFNAQAFFYYYRDSVPTRVRVRLYFVKAICILQHAGRPLQPYIEYKYGSSEVILRSMAEATAEPELYRVEEVDVQLPIEGRIVIEMKDKVEDFLTFDQSGKNDPVIGTTVIDLEDRWHSLKIKELTNKNMVPREKRPIYNLTPRAVIPSGTLNMWIEMVAGDEAADKKATPLTKPPPMEIQLRFVVISCPTVRGGQTTNVKVGFQLGCPEYGGPHPAQQKTDVHAKCTGEAKFNWRIVYPNIKMPPTSITVTIDVYDSNLLSGDTLLGTTQIDIRSYVMKVFETLEAIRVTSTLPVRGAADEDDDGVEDEVAKVRFSMHVLTEVEAQSRPVGLARNEPNEDPQLSMPQEGRDLADMLIPSLGISLPGPWAFYKKVLPLIIFVIVALVLLRYVGLL